MRETALNRTGRKHECFNTCLKSQPRRGTPCRKPLKTLEAGTGIEPVFTDLQSNRFRSQNNALTAKKYQDAARTGGEHDTVSNQPDTPAKENPDALASAIGAGNIGRNIQDGGYRTRLLTARILCLAIAVCDPDDAVNIMAAALGDLVVGQPLPPFTGFMSEAAHWADLASGPELKAYFLATFEAMTPRDRIAFLAYVTTKGGRGT